MTELEQTIQDKLKKFCKDNNVKLHYYSDNNGTITEFNSEDFTQTPEGDAAKIECEKNYDKALDEVSAKISNKRLTPRSLKEANRKIFDYINDKYEVIADDDAILEIVDDNEVYNPDKVVPNADTMEGIKDYGVGEIAGTPIDEYFNVIYEMSETYKKKNSDYGSATEEMFKEYGINYYLIMLEQKLKRLKSITAKGDSNFESAEDSLLDLANYAILGIKSLREQRKK